MTQPASSGSGNLYTPYSDAVNATEGIHQIFVYSNDVTGGLFSMLMIFTIFMVVFLGSYFSQQRIEGEGDAPASFAVAGYITAGATFILGLIPGLVSIEVTSIVIAVAVAGTIWLYFSRG